jgi:hypothetical protein
MAMQSQDPYRHAHMSVQPQHALDIDENQAFQRHSWRVQRIGWVALALVIALALGGGLGPGPLGDRKLTRGDLTLRYDRFVRVEAPASVHLALRAQTDRSAEFWLSGDWLERVHLETIVPEPDEVFTRDGRVHIRLPADRHGAEVKATLHFEADAWGSSHGLVGEPGQPGLALEQFAYP